MLNTVFLPELALMVMVLVLFFMTLGKFRTGTIQLVSLALTALTLAAAIASYGAKGSLFFDAYQVDTLSQLFKIVIVSGLFLIYGLGRGLTGIDSRLHAEYNMFLGISALGLVMLSSAVELLTLLLCLEISSYALYVVIPFRSGQGRMHVEAGIKYVLFGAAATGLTLYGMSYLFGLAHTTYLGELAQVMPALVATQPLAILASVLVLTCFFYKLALFPMHFWTPDVYQGSANETASFVATLPKVGAVLLLLRLVAVAGADITQLTWVLASIAVLSMTLGNLTALVQTDLKRLLAYSSIAHAGYVMLGILSVDELGMAAAVFYVIGYLLMNLGCFYVIYNIAPEGQNVTFDDLKGLSRRSPLLALTLLVSAFGMAGIPPTIGFIGKFMIFTGAIHKGFYALVILAVINAAVAAFYYLKLARAAYTAADDDQEPIALPLTTQAMGLFFILAIILVGALPQSFLAAAREAVAVLL
ncbi:MAG: NADH-quinone oxidoreductase subunit N [Desulfuromonas thiophila]|jgi:NADH-quinone oxidoreductase subunit N|nr:NADH-quinone oxidoreductase subunit N [Desulfuromonas thiophila]MDY0398734.1 NADH-quinone oxidoreductase subunit N [Desulfuromonas thiophila]